MRARVEEVYRAIFELVNGPSGRGLVYEITRTSIYRTIISIPAYPGRR